MTFESHLPEQVHPKVTFDSHFDFGVFGKVTFRVTLGVTFRVTFKRQGLLRAAGAAPPEFVKKHKVPGGQATRGGR